MLYAIKCRFSIIFLELRNEKEGKVDVRIVSVWMCKKENKTFFLHLVYTIAIWKKK